MLSLIVWMLVCTHTSVTGSAQTSPCPGLRRWAPGPLGRPVISEQIMVSWFTTHLSSVSFSLIFLPTQTSWGQVTWPHIGGTLSYSSWGRGDGG